jgi:hypothetical protein
MSGGKPTIERMMARPSRRSAAALGAAVGGVLLGHWVTYLAVSPLAHAREALLHRTGHAYLGFANDAGLVLALSALAWMFLGRLTGRTEAPGFRRLALRLVAFQVTAFAAMEVLERLTSGAPFGELVWDGILLVGVAIQVGSALLVALVVRIVLRGADRVAAVFGQPRPVHVRSFLAIPLPSTPFVFPRRSLAAAGVRGPPAA